MVTKESRIGIYQTPTVLVCQNTTCKERGASAVLAAFTQANIPDNFSLEATGCQGQCNIGPTVRIVPEETWYCLVTPEDVPEIVQQHLREGNSVKNKLNPRIHLI